MAIPADLLLQEDFDFPINEANLDQIRQSISNRVPLVGGGGMSSLIGTNLTN